MGIGPAGELPDETVSAAGQLAVSPFVCGAIGGALERGAAVGTGVDTVGDGPDWSMWSLTGRSDRRALGITDSHTRWSSSPS